MTVSGLDSGGCSEAEEKLTNLRYIMEELTTVCSYIIYRKNACINGFLQTKKRYFFMQKKTFVVVVVVLNKNDKITCS